MLDDHRCFVLFFCFFSYFRKMLCLLQWSYGPLMCVWKWPIQSLVQSPRSLQWHTGKDFTYSTIIFHNLVFTKIKYTFVILCSQPSFLTCLCFAFVVDGPDFCVCKVEVDIHVVIENCQTTHPSTLEHFSEYMQDAFVKIVRGEGVKALWSGLPPTL